MELPNVFLCGDLHGASIGGNGGGVDTERKGDTECQPGRNCQSA